MSAQQATITAKFVNPVKPGGKFANIKDQTDNVWFAEPADIANVQRGQTITVEYEVQKWTKGPVNVISRVLDEAPRTGGTQAPEGVAQQPMYRKTSADESMEMFVRGVMCSVFHGLGQLPDARTIASMVYHLRQAWTAGFAADLKPLPERSHSPQAAPAAVDGFKQVSDAVPETLRKSMAQDASAPF